MIRASSSSAALTGFIENEGLLTVKVVRGSDVGPASVHGGLCHKRTSLPWRVWTTWRPMERCIRRGRRLQDLSVPILWNRPLEQDRVFHPDPEQSLTPAWFSGPRRRVSRFWTPRASTGSSVSVCSRTAASQLTLGGSVHPRFQDYFDLYPIEVSTNLIDWTPLVTLQRTNSSTNLLTYCDTCSARLPRRDSIARWAANSSTPVCQPTGPFPAGMTSRLLTDPSRRNRYGISTNGSFMVFDLVPGGPGPRPAPRLVRRWSVGQRFCLDRAYWGNESFAAERLPYFRSHALPEARCASGQAPYPILVYSPARVHAQHPGGCGPDLASHGYVVVAIDHFDAPGTVFPDWNHPPRRLVR